MLFVCRICADLIVICAILSNNRGILCRMSAEFVQNKEIRYGIRIYKKGVKLIAATLSRHVASP